jgi:glycopeptide antibiotics resistance protein
MSRWDWCWTRLAPLLFWIAVILWIASRPKTALFPSDMKTFLGMPREWLQYPYHFSAFFVLAILFRRCLSARSKLLSGYKPVVQSLLGCALVSFGSEWIQFYVPTRTPAVRDLVLDQSGATLGLTMMRHFSDKIFRVGQ